MQTNGMTHMNTLKPLKTETQELLSTTDYDSFKAIIGNRPIFEPHLRRLISSIEENNMLPQNPIVVNAEMRVIDGQHRLLAAKALGLPIYYTIKSDANLTEVQMLNANNRSWTTYDYLESYIAKGIQEYVQLKEFADEYRISVPIAMRILQDRFDSRHLLADFRGGAFKIANMEKAQNLASLISEVRKHTPDGAWAHNACIKALAIMQVKMNTKIFTDALEQYQQVVTRRVSVKDYLRQFENIINAGREGKQIYLA